MNLNYPEIDTKKLPLGFAKEFTNFMDGGANTGMFDKGRFSLESVEYRSSVKELLKLYSSKVHEFESSNFNLEVLRSSIVGTKSTSSNDLSDFSSVCEVISNSTSSRAILVYRCHELSSNGVVTAARTGDIKFIEDRISRGLDIDARSANNETMLILASMSGQIDTVAWLLRYGANENLIDNHNGSALYYAAVNGHVAVARKLLDSNASTAQVSLLNKTPLMAAVYNNYLELSSLLIEANSRVNHQDHLGWSALYYAVWNENVEITKLLLDNGAKSGLKDKDGYTPSDIAKARNSDEIQALL